jgi:hypothetical protein
MRYRIRVKALWIDRSVGLEGYVGAILMDGTQVALCSVEKWNQGPSDSLRRGWEHDQKVFGKLGKVIFQDYSEAALRCDGLLHLPKNDALRELVAKWQKL